jgi:HD-like signal output (HDOD) protein
VTGSSVKAVPRETSEGAEPALAGRLLQLANAAAVKVSRKRVTDLRTAIARIGFDLVRGSAIAFAMSQLTGAEARG